MKDLVLYVCPASGTRRGMEYLGYPMGYGISATIWDMPPTMGSNLCENEECATNVMDFFKNFCFPEIFDNPASAPAGLWQAVWPGILAEISSVPWVVF